MQPREPDQDTLHSGDSGPALSQVSSQHKNPRKITSTNLLDRSGRNPSRNPKNKKVWERKFIHHKLYKFIKNNYKTHSSSLASTNDEGSDSMTRSNLKTILDKYNAYIKVVQDSNSFYRIMAIHHIKYLLESPQSQQILIHIIDTLSSDDFEIEVLKGVPQMDLPVHLFKKPKLIQIYKSLITGLKKKQDDSDFFKAMTVMLNTYTIFDFALVAIYRLYTYYKGLKPIESEDLDYLLGNEQEQILNYEADVTPSIIQLMTECFRCRVQQYSIDKLDIFLTRYGVFHQQQQQQQQNNQKEEKNNNNSQKVQQPQKNNKTCVDFQFSILRQKKQLSILCFGHFNREKHKFSRFNQNTQSIAEDKEEHEGSDQGLPQFGEQPKPRRLTEYQSKRQPQGVPLLRPQVKHRHINLSKVTNKNLSQKRVIAADYMPKTDEKGAENAQIRVQFPESPKDQFRGYHDEQPSPQFAMPRRQQHNFNPLLSQDRIVEEQDESFFPATSSISILRRGTAEEIPLVVIDTVPLTHQESVHSEASFSRTRIHKTTPILPDPQEIVDYSEELHVARPSAVHLHSYSLGQIKREVEIEDPPSRRIHQYLQKFSELKNQEQEFFDDIYEKMTEKEKKQIVVEYLRRKLEKQYGQKKARQEDTGRGRNDLAMTRISMKPGRISDNSTELHSENTYELMMDTQFRKHVISRKVQDPNI